MKNKKWTVTLLVALLTAAVLPVAYAQPPQPSPAAPDAPATPPPAPLDADKVSYAIGVTMGRSMVSQLQGDGVEFNADRLVEGYRDAVTGAEAEMSYEDIDATMKSLVASIPSLQQQAAQKNLERGDAFLAENKAKEGVQTTESGLQYRVIQEGTGDTPTGDDTVSVNYRGRLINGYVFDSSYRRGQPASLPVSGVIPGWQEALKMMKEGAKWEIFIPANLAYGQRRQPGIPANSALIFDVELVEVMPKAQEQEQPQGAEIPLPQPAPNQ